MTAPDDDADWQAGDSAGNYTHALAMIREQLAEERKPERGRVDPSERKERQP